MSPAAKRKRSPDGGRSAFPQPPRSLADQVYASLKEAIISGEHPPGQRLFEKDLAAGMGASRTPVRESFRRLEQDGLVERVAAGGVKVVELLPETVEDLFGLRRVLEVYAVELACRRVGPEELAELKGIAATAEQVLADGSLSRSYQLARIFELNSAFHEAIYQATGSRFLIRTLSYIRGIVLTMRNLSIRAETAPQEAWRSHRELIGHLEARDEKAAVELIRRHMDQAAAQVLSVAAGDAREEEGPA